LGEFYRILKAGGKMVISTFRPDVDMSRIYTNLILKIENDPDYVPPNGKDKEDFLKAVRSFANSAAFLLHLEEEGHFKFFSRAELKELLESARFERVEFYDSFGYPPQAYVAVCSK
jgi:ubiquinone/menaquinone biosynthesis C-methylase UbiE